MTKQTYYLVFTKKKQGPHTKVHSSFIRSNKNVIIAQISNNR